MGKHPVHTNHGTMLDTALIVKGSVGGPLTGVASPVEKSKDMAILGLYGLIPGGNLTVVVGVTSTAERTDDKPSNEAVVKGDHTRDHSGKTKGAKLTLGTGSTSGTEIEKLVKDTVVERSERGSSASIVKIKTRSPFVSNTSKNESDKGSNTPKEATEKRSTHPNQRTRIKMKPPTRRTPLTSPNMK